jgi:hypothetical protein
MGWLGWWIPLYSAYNIFWGLGARVDFHILYSIYSSSSSNMYNIMLFE